MALKMLTAKTIADLDGGMAELIINEALTQAITDLDNRGGDDDKPRTVTIKISLERVKSGEMMADVEAGWKGPAYRTSKTMAVLRQESKGKVGAHFQPHVPENPHQEPLFNPDEDGDNGKGGKKKE